MNTRNVTKLFGMLVAINRLVSVPDPKSTPAWIAFSILRPGSNIYAPDEVWG